MEKDLFSGQQTEVDGEIVFDFSGGPGDIYIVGDY